MKRKGTGILFDVLRLSIISSKTRCVTINFIDQFHHTFQAVLNCATWCTFNYYKLLIKNFYFHCWKNKKKHECMKQMAASKQIHISWKTYNKNKIIMIMINRQYKKNQTHTRHHLRTNLLLEIWTHIPIWHF